MSREDIERLAIKLICTSINSRENGQYLSPPDSFKNKDYSDIARAAYECHKRNPKFDDMYPVAEELVAIGRGDLIATVMDFYTEVDNDALLNERAKTKSINEGFYD